MIGVVDVGVGNIKSITNWLDRSLISWELINKSENIFKYQVLILPGVGSAPVFMERLRKEGYEAELKKARIFGIRILGICLGAQALFNHFEEGHVAGLGFLVGNVPKLIGDKSNTGWLPFSFNRNKLPSEWLSIKNPNYKKVKIKGRVFFNHNYAILPDEKMNYEIKIDHKDIAQFSAFVAHENLIGIQFHPEKSQLIGEQLIKMILS